MSIRDIEIIEKIICYCDEIEEAKNRFGGALEALQSDNLYKNAVSMSLLQIGELSAHLTDEFKSEYNKMPWQDIRGMRNIAVHHYGKFDVQKLWETITNDIPMLSAYCKALL